MLSGGVAAMLAPNGPQAPGVMWRVCGSGGRGGGSVCTVVLAVALALKAWALAEGARWRCSARRCGGYRGGRQPAMADKWPGRDGGDGGASEGRGGGTALVACG